MPILKRRPSILDLLQTPIDTPQPDEPLLPEDMLTGTVPFDAARAVGIEAMTGDADRGMGGPPPAPYQAKTGDLPDDLWAKIRGLEDYRPPDRVATPSEIAKLAAIPLAPAIFGSGTGASAAANALAWQFPLAEGAVRGALDRVSPDINKGLDDLRRGAVENTPANRLSRMKEQAGIRQRDWSDDLRQGVDEFIVSQAEPRGIVAGGLLGMGNKAVESPGNALNAAERMLRAPSRYFPSADAEGNQLFRSGLSPDMDKVGEDLAAAAQVAKDAASKTRGRFGNMKLGSTAEKATGPTGSVTPDAVPSFDPAVLSFEQRAMLNTIQSGRGAYLSRGQINSLAKAIGFTPGDKKSNAEIIDQINTLTGAKPPVKGPLASEGRVVSGQTTEPTAPTGETLVAHLNRYLTENGDGDKKRAFEGLMQKAQSGSIKADEAQVQALAQEMGITDPNTLTGLRSVFGVQPTKPARTRAAKPAPTTPVEPPPTPPAVSYTHLTLPTKA